MEGISVRAECGHNIQMNDETISSLGFVCAKGDDFEFGFFCSECGKETVVKQGSILQELDTMKRFVRLVLCVLGFTEDEIQITEETHLKNDLCFDENEIDHLSYITEYEFHGVPVPFEKALELETVKDWVEYLDNGLSEFNEFLRKKHMEADREAFSPLRV